MSLIKQVFNLRGDIVKYNEMYNATSDKMFTIDEAEAYQKKLNRQRQTIENKEIKLTKSVAASAISVASFAYNYAAKTTRFGLRGQDVQDQLKLQDKLINKAFGVAGATVVGGPYAGMAALIGAFVSEVISVSIQNKSYEYNKMIDEQQKSIKQERIGRAVYSSSRRA